MMWTHDGGQLQHDEQHAFRYEVQDHGNVIGFITADRDRRHPDVRWKPSAFCGGGTVELDGSYRTAEEALTAFQVHGR
ncbi:MAG: hypothetical protein ABSG70_03460 [Terriglobales bacterium]